MEAFERETVERKAQFMHCDSRRCLEDCPMFGQLVDNLKISCIQHPSYLAHTAFSSMSIHNFTYRLQYYSILPMNYQIQANFTTIQKFGSSLYIYNETAVGLFYIVHIETQLPKYVEQNFEAHRPIFTIQTKHYSSEYDVYIYYRSQIVSYCPSNKTSWLPIPTDNILIKISIWIPSPLMEIFTFYSRPGYYINVSVIDWNITKTRELAKGHDCRLWSILLESVHVGCQRYMSYVDQCKHSLLKDLNIVTPFRHLIIQTAGHLRSIHQTEYYILRLKETSCTQHLLWNFIRHSASLDVQWKAKHGFFHFNASIYMIYFKCPVIDIPSGNEPCIWYTPWRAPDLPAPVWCCTKFVMPPDIVACTAEVEVNIYEQCEQEVTIFENVDQILYNISSGYHHFYITIKSSTIYVLLKGRSCFLSKLRVKFTVFHPSVAELPNAHPNHYIVSSPEKSVIVSRARQMSVLLVGGHTAGKLNEIIYYQDVQVNDAETLYKVYDLFSVHFIEVFIQGECDVQYTVSYETHLSHPVRQKLSYNETFLDYFFPFGTMINLTIQTLNYTAEQCIVNFTHLEISFPSSGHSINSFLYKNVFNISYCPDNFVKVETYCLVIISRLNHNWLQYQKICKSMDSNLASVNTKLKLFTVNKFIDVTGFVNRKDSFSMFAYVGLKRDERVSIYLNVHFLRSNTLFRIFHY